MKIGQPIAVILLSTLAVAQGTTPQKTQTPAKSTPAKSVPAKTTQAPTSKPAAPAPTTAAPTPAPAAQPGPNDVVVTVNGVCPAGTPADSCKRTITRAEFERVIAALGQDVPPESRRQLAAVYVQLLALANEAEKEGLDKDPNFAERMRLERMRVLAQSVERKMQGAAKPSEQDVDNFYAENSPRFEEFSLRRIVIPKTIGGEAKVDEMKALATKVRERAAAGEDPDKLEAEVYATAKVPGAPPATSLGWKRRGAMDPRHEPQIINLRSGQLSEILEDAQSFYIYKVDSKRIIPLATVRDDIERVLANQGAENRLRALLGGVRVDMNDAYFGPPPAPRPATPPQQQPATPPKQ